MWLYPILLSLSVLKYSVLPNVLIRGELYKSAAVIRITSWFNYWQRNLHRCKWKGEKSVNYLKLKSKLPLWELLLGFVCHAKNVYPCRSQSPIEGA